MTFTNETKIKEILPLIDDICTVYTKNRGLIGAAFGNMRLDEVAGIVNMLRGVINK